MRMHIYMQTMPLERKAALNCDSRMHSLLEVAPAFFVRHCYSTVRTEVSWKFSPQALLNPHQAINPSPGHSTSLSLYFSTFLHGEA